MVRERKCEAMKAEPVILELYNDAVSRAELVAPKSREYIEAFVIAADAF